MQTMKKKKKVRTLMVVRQVRVNSQKVMPLIVSLSKLLPHIVPSVLANPTRWMTTCTVKRKWRVKREKMVKLDFLKAMKSNMSNQRGRK